MIQVEPGETITVGSDPQSFDLTGLRNTTGGEDLPITELRAYDNDNPETGTLVNTVDVGSDDSDVELSASDFGNTFGMYYPYDGQNVVDNPIDVTEESGSVVDNQTANETTTTEVTETPNETVTTETTTEEVTTEMTAQPTFTTMQEETTPSPTTTATPVSIPIVLGALGIFGLLIAVRRNKR